MQASETVALFPARWRYFGQSENGNREIAAPGSLFLLTQKRNSEKQPEERMMINGHSSQGACRVVLLRGEHRYIVTEKGGSRVTTTIEQIRQWA